MSRTPLTAADLFDAAAFVRGTVHTADGRTYNPGDAERGELADALDAAARRHLVGDDVTTA